MFSSCLLRCKSVRQALIVTSVDYLGLARLRACIYGRLLASKQLSAVFHRYTAATFAATMLFLVSPRKYLQQNSASATANQWCPRAGQKLCLGRAASTRIAAACDNANVYTSVSGSRRSPRLTV
ncbi:uncharacterized protein M421DRAFT_355509 [Didymella exigua CBS 183.55]|uniref:Uncharacterized protein n=1 Tax=Didymella exigua CBS 183.55 TaxID=1150837 RepID=A0A6A5RST5_9PLEO|nr:uncharacterized protein M421DRAFT_355509 [Didymella exigua CBS 183.55]KAF1930649.1 hypothetical protein M421DRAFT_355509 [Didymella exigua CBS 183.55]